MGLVSAMGFGASVWWFDWGQQAQGLGIFGGSHLAACEVKDCRWLRLLWLWVFVVLFDDLERARDQTLCIGCWLDYGGSYVKCYRRIGWR